MNKPHITTEKCTGDVVLQEVRRIKEMLGNEYGHDIQKLFEIIKKNEEQSTHPVAQLQPLRPNR